MHVRKLCCVSPCVKAKTCTNLFAVSELVCNEIIRGNIVQVGGLILKHNTDRKGTEMHS